MILVSLFSLTSFSKHILHISSAVFHMLGSINRTSKHFNNSNTIKILFCSSFHSRFEYCSIVWTPHHCYLCCKLDSIQHQFLCLAFRILNCNMFRYDHNYLPQLILINFLLSIVEFFLIYFLVLKFQMVFPDVLIFYQSSI